MSFGCSADQLPYGNNVSVGEQLKEEGINRAAEAAGSNLELARQAAKDAALKNSDNEVTIDDVRDALDFNLGPASGAVFRGSDWQFTGKRVKSTFPANHAREIKVWRYVGE